MNPVLTLQDVTVAYDRYPAVHHISGSFAPGTLSAITGSNGAGKTTLLKAIAGVLPVFEGRIVWREDMDAHDIAYLPQEKGLQRDVPIPLLAMICTGFWHRTGGLRAITRVQRQVAAEALAAVGLAGLEARTPGTLSAGQLQRALFARVMVQNARVILLDEPFDAVDAATTGVLLTMLREWRKEGRTVIAVLHDRSQILQDFDTCITLNRECVAWGNPQDVLSAPPHRGCA